MSEARESLRELIGQTLARSPKAEPDQLTALVLGEMTQAHAHEAIRVGVRHMVMAEINFSRMPTDHGQTVNGPSRWRQMTPERRYVNGKWKFYEDFTVDDLLKLADEYEDLSAKLTKRAKEAREDARRLKQSGCNTLRELRAHELRSAA